MVDALDPNLLAPLFRESLLEIRGTAPRMEANASDAVAVSERACHSCRQRRVKVRDPGSHPASPRGRLLTITSATKESLAVYDARS